MQGIELSEQYYLSYGVKMIEDNFPEFKNRIATGLVGDGSECYGFDDDISQDHDWGPGFCLWLNKDDYKAIGQQLELEYEKLPKTFKGYNRLLSKWGSGRVGVHETGEFYRKFTGYSDVPDTLEKWLNLPEEFLSKCTNGKLFFDPLGEFTKIRNKLINFYPEDVRLVKIAAKCMTCAQSGQYNFMRSVRRKQYFSALYAQTQFCSDIISMVFLLNKHYAPFYKWKHQAVASLPILGMFLFENINVIIAAGDYKKKESVIESICVEVIGELHNQGLSNLASDFLLDHGPVVHSKICDINLKQRDVWLG